MARQKVMVLVGAESSGKTTLAWQLAAHFQTVWQPEFLREYLNRKAEHCPGFHFAKVPLISAAEAEHMAYAQLAAESIFLRQHAERPCLFLDTDLLMNYLYYKIYFEESLLWMERVLREGNNRHYLLLSPDLPWEPDPQREGPHVKQQIFQHTAQLLSEWALPFSLVKGQGMQRWLSAVEVVQQICRG
jgi:nicotinamide riboside kinase